MHVHLNCYETRHEQEKVSLQSTLTVINQKKVPAFKIFVMDFFDNFFLTFFFNYFYKKHSFVTFC